MNPSNRHRKWFIPALLLSSTLYLIPRLINSQAQQAPAGQKPAQAGRAIRVGVGLVQTDVMVFDRQGRFVSDLKPEQFELRVDDKPQPISFLELVYTGSPHDQEIWAKAEGKPVPVTPQPVVSSSDAGRTILFFVDDWHLSADSVIRSRAAMAKLIDTSMGVRDRAAIFAASGQLGFLQQLTDNKAVLHAALERFNFQSAGVQDLEYPPMTEGQAVLIEQNEPDVIEYFVLEVLKVTRNRAEAIERIRARAASLAHTSAAVAERTLSALRDAVRACAALPGRKLIFFLSDGFVLQPQRSDIGHRLQEMTDAAARVGIVIYSLDTRGLVVGLPDATRKRAPDTRGYLAHSGYNEVLPQQDALNALASDTGGRFLKNTNALDAALTTALAEVSRYYLLGWYVDPDTLQPGKYKRIQVAVKDRPDLKVRLRQGRADLSQIVSRAPNKAVEPVPAGTDRIKALTQALEGPFPLDGLPVSLQAGYIYQPGKGYVLSMAYQIDANGGDLYGDNQGVRIDVMGVVGNQKGVGISSFSESLSLPGAPAGQSGPGDKVLAHRRLILLEPGIYQVRVAARDPRSGRLGSVWEWIDLPWITAGKLALSSIFLQDQSVPGREPALTMETLARAPFSIGRSFSVNARVAFFLNIYNGAGVQIQARIYRGNQVAAQSPPRPVPAAQGEITREPVTFSDELALDGLPPGAYTLEVTATDRPGKATASQRVAFWIQ
ncbi:MAG: VWA domain-containing protein [Acidobacteriia bacterium]|nr:VWA domain-containing protein [Terriglobia bacterium]